MHLFSIVLFLTIVAISSAAMPCKTVVMDVHMKKCRLGARAKRSLERSDLLKYDEKLKRKLDSDYLKLDDDLASRKVPLKRQLSPELASYIALPIVTEALNGATKIKTFSNRRYDERDMSLVENSFAQQGNYPVTSSHWLATPFLPSAFGHDPDPDLSPEELDELYNDFYQRLPRASKDEAWKVFLETASKCCQNVDSCLKEAVHVPCLAF